MFSFLKPYIDALFINFIFSPPLSLLVSFRSFEHRLYLTKCCVSEFCMTVTHYITLCNNIGPHHYADWFSTMAKTDVRWNNTTYNECSFSLFQLALSCGSFVANWIFNVYLLYRKNTTHYKLKIHFGQNLAKLFRKIGFIIRCCVTSVTVFFTPYFGEF
jgi:hypothetical protein